MMWVVNLRSRTLNGVLAAMVTLPMGAPSVYAYGAWDHLRPKPSTQVETTLEGLETDVNPNVPPGSPAGVFEELLGDDGFFTKAQIADRLGLSEDTIARDLSFLTQADLLDVRYAGSSRTVYNIQHWAIQTDRVNLIQDVLRLLGARPKKAARDAAIATIAQIKSGQTTVVAQAPALAPEAVADSEASPNQVATNPGVEDGTQYDRSIDADAGAPTAVAEGLTTEEGSGKTFIAWTGAGIMSPELRRDLDKRVRGVIGAAFGDPKAGQQKLALEFGPGAAPLDNQSDDGALRARGQAAYDFLLKAAQTRGVFRTWRKVRVPIGFSNVLEGTASLSEALQQRRVVLLANDDDPALLHADGTGRRSNEEKGTFHLIGSSGGFDWQDTTQSPGSHYLKLALIEDARAAFGEDEASALTFLGVLAAHEAEVLAQGDYVPPSDADDRILNDGYAKIRDFRYQRELTKIETARERQLKQITVEIANVRLGQHIVATGIPEESVSAAMAVLEQARARGDIDGFRVLPTGDDLVVQVNHHHGPNSPAIRRLVVDASTEALRAARDLKVTKESVDNVLSSTTSYVERARLLHIRRGSTPMTERAAEPMLMLHAINGGVGTFNRPIMRSLVNPDTHPSGRIAGDSFTCVVERIEDIRRGRKDRARYVFGPDKMKELTTLVGDHTEWAITEVYAATGRFSQSNPGELVAKLIVEPVDASGYTDAPANPTLMIRVQSGSEALGVFTEAFANPWVAPGGANDAYHLTTIPVSWQRGEANRAPQRGFINVVAYEYTSFGEGRIPRERDITDPFNPVAKPDAGLLTKLGNARAPELQVPFQLAQERAARIAKFMMGHGQMHPFLTTRGAEALAEQARQTVAAFWRPLPKTEMSQAEGGEVDPVVEIANRWSGGRTLSIIKADAGGKGGHLIPPDYFSLAAEVSLDIMREQGLIDSSEHFAVGDDTEVLTVHRKGMDHHDIHISNYQIFWRMVYLATNYELVEGRVQARSAEGVGGQVKRIFDDKIYQKGQDLVSEAARGKPIPALAGLNDEVVARLAAQLRRVGRANHAEAVEYGWTLYKADKGDAAVAVEQPFGGNITGQGPGFAEMPLPPTGPVRIAGFFTDKDGPAAFNPVILWILEQAIQRGFIRKRGGAIAELYDTKGQRHIYLDVETQMDIIRGLAANPDQYNFKRVVSKSKAGWDPANPLDDVGGEWFISASTEKLSVITGGEYRGKDDSVMLAKDEFADLGFEFDARFSYFTQGDGFGSHETTIRPEELATAIATMHSRGVKSAFWIDITGDNQMRFTIGNQVYSDPAFRAIRREGEQITRLLWDVQGAETTPVGVGTWQVERSYPLAKETARITGIDFDMLSGSADESGLKVEDILKKSPFAVAAHVDAAAGLTQSAWVRQYGAIDHQTSAKVARAAHDTRAPKTILLHESFFGYGPDGAIAIQRALSELGFSSLDEAAQNSAVKLEVHLDPIQRSGQRLRVPLWRGNEPPASPSEGRAWAATLAREAVNSLITMSPVVVGAARNYVETNDQGQIIEVGIAVETDQPDQVLRLIWEDQNLPELLQQVAQKDFARLIEGVNRAANGAVNLKPEWFTVVTSVPVEGVTAAIGPSEWLKTTPEGAIKTTLDAPTEGKTVSSASAFYAVVEAIASGNRTLPPEVRQKLRVAGDEGLFTVTETKVDAGVEGDLRAYQETVSEASGKL